MAKFGVNVPPGIAVTKLSEVAEAAKKMDSGGEVVIKSQVLAGGRGLGKFASGFQGGVHICKTSEAEEIAGKMLGGTLITKQTGEKGKPVNHLLIAQKMDLINEMYFAILLDRSMGGPVVIACSEGGTSIEDLAEKYPDKIIKVPINMDAGMTDEQAGKVADALQLKKVDRASAASQIKCLYKMFTESDCTLLEVNPLAESGDGKLISADAKVNFDDNAEFRQTELFSLRDESQEDPREVQAKKADLNYIGLDGSIGCMVNGAGLAMATMDIINLYGAKPANFLDVGGSAAESQIVEAFKILTADVQVKAILVNIFGGIMKCDVIASGIVAAAKQVGVKVPLIVRLEGTNVERGKEIIRESGLTIIAAENLDDAAQKAVAAL
jgi:succinyl-CoA synthetase beta subunit